MAEHDDLELLELIRAEAQRRELQKAPEHEVAERPEQRAAPVVGRTGRRTLRTRTATPTRPELMHPTRLGLGAGSALFRLLPCARRDLLPSFACGSQQTLDLLPRLIERVPHRRRRRRAHLQLRDRPIDPFDVRINSATLVTAHRHRERHIEDLRRHVVSKLTETLPLAPNRRRTLSPIARPRRVISHDTSSMTNPTITGRRDQTNDLNAGRTEQTRLTPPTGTRAS